MIAELFKKIIENKNKFIILSVAFCILNGVVFAEILDIKKAENLELYFLDVGQGDSELVVLPGGVKILIDGGVPGGGLLTELSRAFSFTDRYIDLVVMTHPQLDHFGGLVEVLRRYRIGAFVSSGTAADNATFQELEDVLKEKNIQHIVLAAGDAISYGESRIAVLGPTPALLKSKEPNDTSLVFELESKNTKSLFTGDIGFPGEDTMHFSDIDILKVPHHGSKYSSGMNFLQNIAPEIAVIEVGKNSYGHPTRDTLERLASVGASVYRTDRDGTVKIIIDGERIRVFR